jgi:NADP-dependent 3-hydroxy acid dehydrogenase YdfG
MSGIEGKIVAITGASSGLDVEGWSAMIDVNLRGVLHGIAAALPVFRRQGQGHFVTTVSTAGLKIVPTKPCTPRPRTRSVRSWRIAAGVDRRRAAHHIDITRLRSHRVGRLD